MQPTDGWIGNWAPRFGDHTLTGWLLVVLYLLAAMACWRVLRRVRWEPWQHAEKRLWQAVCALTLALGINKQLDLQTGLINLGRGLAHGLGMYEQKRLVQLAFMALLAVAGVVGGKWLIAHARRSRWEANLAVLGSIALLGFIVLRAAMFQSFLRDSNASWLLEGAALLTICAGALLRYRR